MTTRTQTTNDTNTAIGLADTTLAVVSDTVVGKRSSGRVLPEGVRAALYTLCIATVNVAMRQGWDNWPALCDRAKSYIPRNTGRDE